MSVLASLHGWALGLVFIWGCYVASMWQACSVEHALRKLYEGASVRQFQGRVSHDRPEAQVSPQPVLPSAEDRVAEI